MDKQASIADTQNAITKATQRAFIIVNGGQLRSAHFTPEHKDIVLAITSIINAGNTATKKLEVTMACRTSEKAMSEPWELLGKEDFARVPQVIGPRQSVTGQCYYNLIEFAKVPPGDLHAYLMGEITYFDRLDDARRVTQFDWELLNVQVSLSRYDPRQSRAIAILFRSPAGTARDS